MLQKRKRKNLTEQEKSLNCEFESVDKYFNEIILNPKIVKFSLTTKLYEESLKELQFDETYIQSLKKESKRKINQMHRLNHFTAYKKSLKLKDLLVTKRKFW